MVHLTVSNLFTACLTAAIMVFAPAVRAEVWERIGDASQPPVYMASDGVRIKLRADALDGASPSARLVAARGRVRVKSISAFPDSTDISAESLGDGDLRLYLRVTWTKDGAVRRAETYFSPALADREPNRPEGMSVFDLNEFMSRCEASASRIVIPFDMPYDGQATVIIDDAEGRRVRNLVNAGRFAAGRVEAEWDGRREDGSVASAGTYNVRVVTHKGIRNEYLGQFANGNEREWRPYGPNHCTFTALVAAPDGKVSASAFFTEGGDSTIVMNAAGAKSHGWGESWNFGNEALFLVNGSGETYYSVREGKLDVNGQAKSMFQVFAYRWDSTWRPEVRIKVSDASQIDQPNVIRYSNYASDGRPALSGAAFKDGHLFVGDRRDGRVHVYRCTENGGNMTVEALAQSIPLSDAGAICQVNGNVYASSGGNIYLVKADGYSEYRFTLGTGAKPKAMTSDGTHLYCLHEGHHQVYVYNAGNGAFEKTIGSSDDGDYVGPWDKDRLVNPSSLCCDANGKLWITEDRRNPKRLSRWDVGSGRCEYEKLGSEQYGSPGAGVDPEDPSHWIAENAEWRANIQTGEAEVIGKLMYESRYGDGRWNRPQMMNRNYRWVRRNGRTFVIANAECTTFYELKDHRLVPLAMVSTPGIFSAFLGREHACTPAWEAYHDKFWWKRQDDFFYDEYTPMAWKDLNRNGLIDKNEIEYGEDGTAAAFGYWGSTIAGLDFLMSVKEGESVSILKFDAGGMNDGSLPGWSLANAWENRKKSNDAIPEGGCLPFHHESYADDQYAIIPTTAPYMLGYDSAGRLQWYMDSINPSVHGSHDAPLPVYGEVQSILFACGSAKVDGRTIVAWQNNHGVLYLITTDGVFLEQLFTDCRVAGLSDDSFLGGEPFGGSFEAANNGKVYFQGGGGGCRVYSIEGLHDIKDDTRSTISVSDEQIAAAVRLHPTDDEAAWTAPSAVIPYRAGNSAQDLGRIAEWNSGSNNIKLDAGWNENNLKLRYTVTESSPWVNNGEDPYLMFKTGDCVDLQLGVPGLMRIQVSRQTGGGNGFNVVRYRFTTDEPGANPYNFNSPTHTVHVDDVSFRNDIATSVNVDGGRYIVNLTIPHSVTGFNGNELSGTSISADFGVIFGDAAGKIDLSRAYWSNKSTAIVNDIPEEIAPQQTKWGTIVFGANEGGTSTSDSIATSERQAVFAGYLGNPGGFRAIRNEKDPLFYEMLFTLNPVYDRARGVIRAGAGTGRVAKFRPDGTLLATYILPDAPPFSREDKMALMDDGSVILIAGGAISAYVWDDRSGTLYRIPADAADGSQAQRLNPGVPVNTISAQAHDGKILLHRRRGEIYEYSPNTGTRQIGYLPIGDGIYSICMMNWDQTDTLRILEGDRMLHTFAYNQDGTITDLGNPLNLFGDRELAGPIANFIDGTLWCCNGDTVKRLNGTTFKPEPGVVHGGASGYFIGIAERNGEMGACGMAQIDGNLYALSASAGSATYLMNWNASENKLKEVGRIGVVFDGRSLALDDAGYVYTDGLVWKIGDSSKAAPRQAMDLRTEYGAATMPNGRVVALGRNGEVRFGILSEGLSTHGERFDMSGVAEDAEEVGSFFRSRGDGTYELVRFDSYARAFVFRFKEDGSPITDAGWSNDYNWPVPGNIEVSGFSIDAGRIAITDRANGTLRILNLASGKQLASVDNLREPTRVALRSENVVVYESGAQRLSAFKLAVPAEWSVSEYADPSIKPGNYFWDRNCESGYWGEASKWHAESVDGPATAFAPDGTEGVIANFNGADARIDSDVSGEFHNIVLTDNSTLRIALGSDHTLRAADNARARWNGCAIDTDYGDNSILVSGGTLDLNGSGFWFWHDGNTIEASYGGRINDFSVKNCYHDDGFRNVFRARDGGTIQGSGTILYAPSGDLLEASSGTVSFSGDITVQDSGTVTVSIGGENGSVTAARIVRTADGAIRLEFKPSARGRTAGGAYLTLTGNDALPSGGVSVAFVEPAEWDASFPKDGTVALVQVGEGQSAALSAIVANTPQDAVQGGRLDVSADGRTLLYVRSVPLRDALGFEGAQATVSGTDTVLAWTGDGKVVVPSDCRIDVLLVGGGGGGGTIMGGGGGGGGAVYVQGLFVKAGEYAIHVGAGGDGATWDGTVIAANGGDTTAFGLVALGGGAGGGSGFNDNCYWDGSVAGRDGGTGGGASGHRADLGAGAPTPGSGTAGQGRMGGNAISHKNNDFSYDTGAGGGGGGAGASGGSAYWNAELSLLAGGHGGDGLLCDITGTATYYGGGGGGGTSAPYHDFYSAGGLGGGGRGGFHSTSVARAIPGENGTDGLGGGGGGAGGYTDRYDFPENNVPAGQGGSGTVIIRYSTASFHFANNAAMAGAYEINQTTSTPYFGSDASVNAFLPAEKNILRGLVPSFSQGTIREGYGANGEFYETQTSNWGCLTDGLVPQHPKEYDNNRDYNELVDARYLISDNSVLEWTFPETDLQSVRFWVQWPDGSRNDIAVQSIEVRVGGEWKTLDGSAFCSGKNVNASVENNLEPYMDSSVKKRCVFFAPIYDEPLATAVTGLRITFPEQELGYTCFWEIEAERPTARMSMRPAPKTTGISVSGGKVALSLANAVKGVRYGYKFAERLEDLDSAPTVWLPYPASVDGEALLNLNRSAGSGFYKVVSEDW